MNLRTAAEWGSLQGNVRQVISVSGRSWMAEVPRRTFLKGVAASVGTATVLGACDSDTDEAARGLVDHDAPQRSPNPPPSAPPGILQFFTRHEFATVAAIAEQIFPADDEAPGATEAGVANFVDRMMASYQGFAQPTYRSPPYMETYEGRVPAPRPDIVFVPEDEAERYGFQSQLGPQDIYREGLAALDRHCRDQRGGSFIDLNEDQQVAVLRDLEDDEIDTFDDPSAALFFQILHDDTMQGVFGDPLYGGNRDKIGWKMIGYPGAWRGYQPSQMRSDGFTFAEPVSLAEAAHFHPGEPANEHVKLPVQGSNRRRRR